MNSALLSRSKQCFHVGALMHFELNCMRTKCTAPPGGFRVEKSYTQS